MSVSAGSPRRVRLHASRLHGSAPLSARTLSAEYAVVSRTNGTRALVYGGTDGIDFTEFTDLRRLLGHSHPIGYPNPSAADFQMLESLGQRSSWVYEENMTRFGVRPIGG